LHERQFQFEWDDVKAATNLRKHGVSFELARTVNDVLLLPFRIWSAVKPKRDGSQLDALETVQYFL